MHASEIAGSRPHIFGSEALDNASIATPLEWDVKGLHAIKIVLGLGVDVTASSTPTVFTIHASETSGFTPGVANDITGAAITTGFPDAAGEFCEVTIINPGQYGRYYNVIATVGNGAAVSEVTCFGFGLPANEVGTDNTGATASAIVG